MPKTKRAKKQQAKRKAVAKDVKRLMRSMSKMSKKARKRAVKAVPHA